MPALQLRSISIMLEKYLEDLEKRIDPATEDQLFAEWQQFTDGEFRDGIFSPKRQISAPPAIAWDEDLSQDNAYPGCVQPA